MSRMYGSRGGDEETCPQGNAPCPYPNVQGCPLLCGAGRSLTLSHGVSGLRRRISPRRGGPDGPGGGKPSRVPGRHATQTFGQDEAVRAPKHTPTLPSKALTERKVMCGPRTSALRLTAAGHQPSCWPARATRRAEWPASAHPPLPARLPRPGRPHPHKQAVAWHCNAWSNAESTRVVRAPTPLASPLSISLATMWGFAR